MFIKILNVLNIIINKYKELVRKKMYIVLPYIKNVIIIILIFHYNFKKYINAKIIYDHSNSESLIYDVNKLLYIKRKLVFYIMLVQNVRNK